MKRIYIIILCTVISLSFFSYLLVEVHRAVDDNVSGNTISIFSKKNWNIKPYQRLNMVDDLLKRYDLTKMEKNEVLELLGHHSLLETEEGLQYGLGKNKNDFIPVNYYLWIKIDSEGNVEYVDVYKE